MNRIVLCVTLCTIAAAANVSAAVSQQYQDWGNSAVQYLMTTQERIAWQGVRTDADAKAFVDLFWARRDPTPETPVNELRQEFEQRIAEADKRYAFGKTKGSQTDPGLVYVLLGEPSQIVHRIQTPAPGETRMTMFQRPVNIATWIYQGEAAERVAGTKAFNVAFVFHDDKAANDFELDGPSRQSFDTTTLAVAKRMLKRPFLTAGDLASGGESVRAVALGLIVVSDKALAEDILKRVQEGQKFADLARKYSQHHSAKDGGYMGRMPFAELSEDFQTALNAKTPGTTALIARPPQYAVVRLLTDAEVSAAEGVIPGPK